MSDRDALMLTLIRGLEGAATALDVVDDETRWNKDFGRNVLVGLLGLPENASGAKKRALPPPVNRSPPSCWRRSKTPTARARRRRRRTSGGTPS